MNTSELFFNTPVIDEQGQVKNLSDFGGGGGALPIASAETLGGVKIGSGVTVTEDGTISVVGASIVANGDVTGRTAVTVSMEAGHLYILYATRTDGYTDCATVIGSLIYNDVQGGANIIQSGTAFSVASTGKTFKFSALANEVKYRYVVIKL